MLPILQIGPLAIPFPTVILLLAIWIGMGQAEKLAPRYQMNANRLLNLVMLGLAAGVIGARLAFAARFPGAFLDDPVSLLAPRAVMLDLPGGLLIGALAALIYGQRLKVPLWPTLDALTPTMAIFAIGFALSQLASGDGYGASTRLPWGIALWGAVRHPTQIYAVIAAILITVLVWPRQGKGEQSFFWRAGNTFLSFVALSAFARILLEPFRGDSVLLAGGLRQAQLAGWLILAASLWLIGKRMQTRVHEKPAIME
ncbi:MAG TPA: prolipoprotein diacylglyceryl transferase family protein [Levilinea sp.]|nr:prolipoprotein diacylglyceryl transferase family protein [Levilinea sp.]